MSLSTNENEITQLSSRFAHLDPQQNSSVPPKPSESAALSLNPSGRRRRRRRKKSKTCDKTKCTVPSNAESVPASNLPLDKDVLGNAVVYLKPRGFCNVKNSCYLNASLQLLFQIPQFCGALQVLQQKQPVEIIQSDPTQTLDKHQCVQLLPVLLKLFAQFSPSVPGSRPEQSSTSTPNGFGDQNGPRKWTSNESTLHSSTPGSDNRTRIRSMDLGAPISPDGALFRLLNLDTGFQEDCAECLTQILTKLHEETASSNESDSAAQKSLGFGHDADVDDGSDWIVTDRTGKRRPEARKTELEGGCSPISHLFSGVMVNRSTVNHAKHATARRGAQEPIGSHSQPVLVDALIRNATCKSVKEPFFILPLEINDPKVTSVESALLSLSNREEVFDYRDPLTGMASTVRRYACLDQLPPFFLIQLKRFTVNPSIAAAPHSRGHTVSNGVMGKSLKLIPIQQELIIPTKLLNAETQFSLDQRSYRLRAVIFHVGLTATSGHYTVAVRYNANPDSRSSSASAQPKNSCDAPSPSTSFLYLDDTHGCLLPDGESQRLLFTTHRPLNARTGHFQPLPNPTTAPSDRPPITQQPRTPYILVYESLQCYKRKC